MVYLLRTHSEGRSFFKIGFTTNIRVRVEDIQTSNPHSVDLVYLKKGTRKDEKELHKKLYKYRVRGEWFKNSEELRNIFRLYEGPSQWSKLPRDWKANLFLLNCAPICLLYSDFCSIFKLSNGFQRNRTGRLHNYSGGEVALMTYEQALLYGYMGVQFTGFKDVIYVRSEDVETI